MGEPCRDDLVFVASADAGSPHCHLALFRDGSPDSNWGQRLSGSRWLELRGWFHWILVRFRHLRLDDHPLDVASGTRPPSRVGLAIEDLPAARFRSDEGLDPRRDRVGGGPFDALGHWIGWFPLQNRALCKVAPEFGLRDGSFGTFRVCDPMGRDSQV